MWKDALMRNKTTLKLDSYRVGDENADKSKAKAKDLINLLINLINLLSRVIIPHTVFSICLRGITSLHPAV